MPVVSEQPTLVRACERVDLDQFVDEFGDCIVQERHGALPSEFRLTRLAEFDAETRGAAIDRRSGRYIFHDNLVAVDARGSTERLDELFDRHQPTDELVARSIHQPCVAMRLAFGGPDSGTPTPHVHGPAECLLLAGCKRWWLWPPQAAALVEWIVRGRRLADPLVFWEQHVAPIFENRSGDVTDRVCDALDDLRARGLFSPPTPGAEPGFDASRGVVAEHYRPRTLEQRAGDIVFVPESWSHGVRNDDWSLAIIYELGVSGQP
jgi:hypothetical protein